MAFSFGGQASSAQVWNGDRIQSIIITWINHLAICVRWAFEIIAQISQRKMPSSSFVCLGMLSLLQSLSQEAAIHLGRLNLWYGNLFCYRLASVLGPPQQQLLAFLAAALALALAGSTLHLPAPHLPTHLDSLLHLCHPFLEHHLPPFSEGRLQLLQLQVSYMYICIFAFGIGVNSVYYLNLLYGVNHMTHLCFSGLFGGSSTAFSFSSPSLFGASSQPASTASLFGGSSTPSFGIFGQQTSQPSSTQSQLVPSAFPTGQYLLNFRYCQLYLSSLEVGLKAVQNLVQNGKLAVFKKNSAQQLTSFPVSSINLANDAVHVAEYDQHIFWLCWGYNPFVKMDLPSCMQPILGSWGLEAI